MTLQNMKPIFTMLMPTSTRCCAQTDHCKQEKNIKHPMQTNWWKRPDQVRPKTRLVSMQCSQNRVSGQHRPIWQWHQTCTELFAGFLWILFLCVIIFLILYFIFFVFSKFPSITKSTTMVTTRTWNMHKNCLFCFVFFSKFTSMTTSTFWTTITRTSSMHHAEELAGIFNF